MPLSTQVRTSFESLAGRQSCQGGVWTDFCTGLAAAAAAAHLCAPSTSPTHPPIRPCPALPPSGLPAGSWGFYGLLNWLPSFFKDHYHVEISQLASFTLLPYLVQGGVGAASGGAGDCLAGLGW